MRLAGVVLGAALLAIPDTAAASDRVFWEGAYRRATHVSLVGGAMGASGATLTLAGVIAGNPNTATLGVLAFLAGGPVMAAGSLRARRALRQLRRPVTPVPGYLAWGLWGGSIGLAVALGDNASTNTSAALVGMLFGVYSAAGLQMVLNTLAWRGHHPAPPRQPPRTLRIDVVPIAGAAGHGLALVSSW